ncbi:MAG: hypothetical protein Q9160_003534 [Pyrenula sp. 1 TL-2023]
MKRKLDDHDVPAAVDSSSPERSHQKRPTFEAFNLDTRLLQAVRRESYAEPTPVQAHAIPLALGGKDVLARAKTGSGKTAAYVLPILQSILQRKVSASFKKCTAALVLVPTRELADQVHKTFVAFSMYCAKEVKAINLTQRVSGTVLRSMLDDLPDVVVATPGKANQDLGSSALSLENITHLVVDEADLVLSYGYEEDIKSISQALPRGVQTFLMSATLTTEVDSLRTLLCRSPAILKLDDEKEDEPKLQQYVVKCGEDEKFLLAYVIFKLRLVKGKCIVFVGDLDRSYRLKLFFEQFGIKACVLNSELPVNSRIHIVQEFNKEVYDIIIATDEQEVFGSQKSKSAGEAARAAGEADNAHQEAIHGGTARPPKKRKIGHSDKDYGVSRGIDFHNVACVLNFDLPTSSKSYTHRVGRTARAGKSGMALSFVVPLELYGKHKATTFVPAKHDEEILEKISKQQAKKGKEVKPYQFDMKQIDSFRYRMNDALKAVTRIAVREARARELKQELLKSEKLKRHFEENPEEVRQLRHDGELRGARVQPHLKHVPEYLMPSKARKALTEGEVGFVGLKKEKDNRIRNARLRNKSKGKGSSSRGKRIDPLKTFNAKGR